MSTLIASTPYPRPWRVQEGFYTDDNQRLTLILCDESNPGTVAEFPAEETWLARLICVAVNGMSAKEFAAAMEEHGALP